jgi:hypothetical protein
MVTGTFIVVALMVGYIVAVGLSMAASFGIAKAAPGFVVKDHVLKPSYRIAQEIIWLLCVTVGAYLSAWMTEISLRPMLVAVLLAISLVGILWINTWEMSQRGMGHQIVMSLVSIAGVCAGFTLRLK